MMMMMSIIFVHVSLRVKLGVSLRKEERGRGGGGEEGQHCRLTLKCVCAVWCLQSANIYKIKTTILFLVGMWKKR